jgi:hypothetical protein
LLQSSGTGDIEFSTGGSVKAILDDSGNLAVDTNTLYVDAANNRVGIGTATPTAGYALDVFSATDYVGATIRNSGHSLLSIQSAASARQALAEFKSASRTYTIGLQTDNTFSVYDNTAAATRLSLDTSGNLAVDGTTFNVDATNNRVGIGTATPAYPLQVRRAGGAGSLGVSIDAVGSTDRTVQYFSVQDSATSVGAGHAFYYRAPSSTTDVLGLMLDENGRVGIGTASPAQRLDVEDSATIAQLRSTSTTAANAPRLRFNHAGNDSFDIGGGDGLIFYSSATTERMRLTSAGNLGVGTSSPSQRLDVSGSVNVRSASPTVFFDRNGSYTWRIANGDGTTYPLSSFNIANNAGTAAITVTAANNVGIGVTPSASLHVERPSADNIIAAIGQTSYEGVLYLSGAGSGKDTSIVIGNGRNLNFKTTATATPTASGTTAMTLTASGNLGVGTTSPTNYGAGYRTISANGTSSGVFEIRANDTVRGLIVGDATDLQIQASGATPMRFFTNSAERARITSAGNVGIGNTNPSYRLQVEKTSISAPAFMVSGAYYGGPRIQTYGLDADGSAWMGLGTDMGGGPYEHTVYFPDTGTWGFLGFGTYNGTTYSEKMRITRTGNVGIGTTSPAQKLEVVGSALVGPSSGKMFIGDVGHGTTYPAIAHQNYATTTGYALLAPSDGYLFLNKRDVAGTYIGFRKANNDLMVIDNAGNVGIGTTSPAQRLHVAGNATAADFILTSDRRRKTDLEVIEDALGKVKRLVGYTYRPIDGERRRAGLMAQDVEAVAPEPVYTDDDGWKSLSYEQMIPYIIEAIKALDKKIEALA